MAIKTFTTGEVLTAADTNTYLANSGLVYVTSFAIGTGVSSVVCANAFNSTYDNYRIIVGGGVASNLSSLALKLGASATGYYATTSYIVYAANTTPLATGDNNNVEWNFAGYVGTTFQQASFDLINPNKAQWTSLTNASWTPSTASGTTNGIHQVATAYTDFTIRPNGAGVTLTGGTVTVYGYRKA